MIKCATLSLLLLLLAKIECLERESGNGNTLVANARNITDTLATTTLTTNSDGIILVDEVEATIAWDEGTDLLIVLLQQHSETLSQRRVRLLRFKAHFRHANATGVRSAS